MAQKKSGSRTKTKKAAPARGSTGKKPIRREVWAVVCLVLAVFCFIGFFNGLGMTRFVMIQGIIGAFLVRIPVAFLMSKEVPVSMFHIGLATPCSTILQVVLCLICFRVAGRKYRAASPPASDHQAEATLPPDLRS